MSQGRHAKICVLASVLALAGLAAAQAGPALECPRAHEGDVSAAMTAAETEILKSEDRIDLATGVNEVINRLQLQQPGLSYAQVVNALIAAYCPVVAALPDLTDAQRQARVARFAALAQQLAPEDSLPAGSQILATVPLPPEVYRRLSAEAAVHNMTTSRFLSKILSGAAGQ